VKSTEAVLGYGIDFGTSNSAISIAYSDRVDVLSLGAAKSSLTLPSFSRRGSDPS
jgi:molecular chaperone DnaK (HSP70)